VSRCESSGRLRLSLGSFVTHCWRGERNEMRLFWLFVIAAATTLALSAADLGGVWKGSMETQGGTVEMIMTLRSGNALAGTVKSDQTGESPIENAKLDGEKISFEINTSYGKVVFEGSVGGDEIKFTVTGTQGTKYPLTCKRQK
jgi:hypothetical protein